VAGKALGPKSKEGTGEQGEGLASGRWPIGWRFFAFFPFFFCLFSPKGKAARGSKARGRPCIFFFILLLFFIIIILFVSRRGPSKRKGKALPLAAGLTALVDFSPLSRKGEGRRGAESGADQESKGKALLWPLVSSRWSIFRVLFFLWTQGKKGDEGGGGCLAYSALISQHATSGNAAAVSLLKLSI
jgi:hypothetical protein